MRFASIVAIACFAASGLASAESSLFKDDQNFWDRLLVTSGESSLTPPPTASPTPPPKACLVEVTATCTDANGVDCAAIPPKTSDCEVPVTYTYTLTNIGDVTMDITELSRTRGGETVDLTGEVVPSTIEVGAFTKVSESETVDFCAAGTYETVIVAKAESLSGLPCDAEDTYVFTVTPPPPTSPPTTAPVVVETDNPSGIPSAIPSDVPTPVPETPPPTPPPTPEPTPPPTPEPTPPPTPEPTPPPTPETPPPTPATPPPTPEPTAKQPVFPPSDTCFAQVDVECIPPVDPADPDGGRFEDCDSINIAPAECTEFVNLLTFRFNGGDCLDSNNIQDPRIYSCEDFFEGPPPADEIGAEAYMIITDIKGQGINYFDGVVAVGDVFNITNILPNTVIVANVNVTIYDGEPAPENIRETLIIHTSCSQVTFLKDRYGVLELIGFQNPSQGYQACIVPVSFDFTIQNTAEGFNAVVESLTVVTNFDPPNNFLNYTDQVVGFELGPGDDLPLSSDPINIDLSVRKRYTAVATVQGVSPEGFSCRGSSFSNFTAGVADTRPTPSPAGP